MLAYYIDSTNFCFLFAQVNALNIWVNGLRIRSSYDTSNGFCWNTRLLGRMLTEPLEKWLNPDIFWKKIITSFTCYSAVLQRLSRMRYAKHGTKKK